MATDTTFGPHLMLDFSGCDKEILGNYRAIYDMLDELPNIIGMTKVIQPYVFPYSGLIPADKGITGVVIIAESHISIHTFEEKGYVFIDVFSCKPFDTDIAIEYFNKKFKPLGAKIHHCERGENFPRD